MWSYVAVVVVHAGLLVGVAWWHLRAYRRAARASRRRVERMLAEATSDALRREVDYLRGRNDILMRGLFPRGEHFLGNFIDQDPELRALLDLVELARGQPLPADIRPTGKDALHTTFVSPPPGSGA